MSHHTDLEKEILAEGEKLRVRVVGDTLRVRKSNLLREIEAIEETLADLEAPAKPEEPAAAVVTPKPAPKPAAPKAPAKKPTSGGR